MGSGFHHPRKAHIGNPFYKRSNEGRCVFGGKKGKQGVLGVLRMFRNDFGIGDIRGGSFVAVDHPCSELVGVLRLFVFAFIHVLQIIKIEGKILFEFEDGVIPQFRVRKVLVPSWFCGVT